MARRSLTAVVYLGFAAAVAALAAVPGGPVWQQPARPPADLVLLNGKVVTADDARPEAQAVAIVGDRIADLGTTEDMKRHVGPNTQVIDLLHKAVYAFVTGAVADGLVEPRPSGAHHPRPLLDKPSRR